MRVEATGSKIAVVVRDADGEQTILGSHLLVATSRRANTEELGLRKPAHRNERGIAPFDEGLKTANKRVYAVGDVVGDLQFTHVANYHAGIVIRNALFRLRAKTNHYTVPWVTFTDPELAHVGLTEARARERHRTVRVLRWPYHENDRAQAEREADGHIKVVTNRKGIVLGATIVGAGAGELITAWTLAVTEGLNVRAFAGIVVPYPTLAEIGKRAAITYFMPSLTSSWMRRIIGLLRRFGWDHVEPSLTLSQRPLGSGTVEQARSPGKRDGREPGTGFVNMADEPAAEGSHRVRPRLGLSGKSSSSRCCS